MELIKGLIKLTEDIDLSNVNKRIADFIKMIQEGTINTDEDFLDQFSHYSSSKIAGIEKSKVKKEILQILIDQYLYSRTAQNEARQEHIYAYKKFAAVKTLIKEHNRNEAIFLAERLIVISINYQLTEITVSLARDLLIHYSVHTVNKRKRDKYLQILNQYQKIQNAEVFADVIYSDVSILFLLKKSYNKKDLLQLSNYVQQLKDHKVESFWYMMIYFNVVAFQFSANNNCEQLIDLCGQAVHFFEQIKAPTSYAARFSFNIKMIPCLIKKGEFERAETLLSLNDVPIRSRNWTVVEHYKYILYAYSGNLEALPGVIEKIENEMPLDDDWKILKALAYQLNGAKINSAKLQNELPVAVKDKSGMNVLIHTIRIIDLLQKDRIPEIIDKLAAIERYLYKYLSKSKATFRSKLFLKMLLMLRYGDKATVEQRAYNLLQKLKENPIIKTTADIDSEPVPFEILWDKVLDLLK